MKMKQPKVVALSFALVIGMMMVGGSALAGDQAAVVLDIQLSGAGCAHSTVVISASSCDCQEIADTLVSKLTAEGFGTVFCGYSGNDMWECMFFVPSGCVLEDFALLTRGGSACGGLTDSWAPAPETNHATFAYNIR
jgi:hypothetical protein